MQHISGISPEDLPASSLKRLPKAKPTATLLTEGDPQ
jgi:hypothetical protein